MAIPQRIAATWKNRHPRLRRWVVAVFCIFVVVGFCIWASAHRHDPDIDLKLTNFLAAFWPFAISVFAAFIPDLEKIDKMRPIWRIGIVAAGLMYSLILWHQQSVALDSSRHDQEHIVVTAVTKAGEHSDQHSDTQTAGVKSDLENVSKHSDQQIDSIRSDLKGSMVAVTGLISKTTTDLSSAISRVVGKPDPPERPQLRFSLWGDGNVNIATAPLVLSALTPDKDGVFTIDYCFQNISRATASKVDVWIYLCPECVYSTEPSGFDRPVGLRESVRHRYFGGALNPGVNTEKTTVLMKTVKVLPWFDISFRYSCETCGSMSDLQTLRILALLQQ